MEEGNRKRKSERQKSTLPTPTTAKLTKAAIKPTILLLTLTIKPMTTFPKAGFDQKGARWF